MIFKTQYLMCENNLKIEANTKIYNELNTKFSLKVRLLLLLNQSCKP